ncbi:MAG: class IV adenylate cyclase [Phycisphaerae bacterium]
MPTETEVKYRVESLREIRDALRALGGEPIGEVVETDCFFDTPAGDLLREDRGIRIRRSVSIRGGSCPGVLTYKGPRDPNSRHKVREEVETTVGDVEAAAAVLRACGLRPVVTIQKRRQRWDMDRCEVSLDELPLLGTFVEIECESVEQIEAVRKALSLDGEAITESYLQLLAEHCPRIGEQCDRVTFESCPGCEHRPTE